MEVLINPTVVHMYMYTYIAKYMCINIYIFAMYFAIYGYQIVMLYILTYPMLLSQLYLYNVGKTERKLHIEAHLRGIVGLVPDHSNKENKLAK